MIHLETRDKIGAYCYAVLRNDDTYIFDGCRPNLYLEVKVRSNNALNDIKPLMIATKKGNRYISDKLFIVRNLVT